MTPKEFEKTVRDAFPYGIEYASGTSYRFSVDGDGEPEGEILLEFGGFKYEIPIIIGEDGEPGINTYDYATIDLSQESVFAWCLFKLQERMTALVRKV